MRGALRRAPFAILCTAIELAKQGSGDQIDQRDTNDTYNSPPARGAFVTRPPKSIRFVAPHSDRLEADTRIWNQFVAGVCDTEEVACRAIPNSVA
jgi:hypothetical protein